MNNKTRRRLREALVRLFEKLCSVKWSVFCVFVVLRLAQLVSADDLKTVALAVLGVNSGMKIAHKLMERGNEGD